GCSGLFRSRRLRRRGRESKRDSLLHLPDARPRAPAEGCGPLHSYKVLVREGHPPNILFALWQGAKFAFVTSCRIITIIVVISLHV
ncbi:MAG: hypothetical protein ACXWOL_18745, partial [Ktedonobacteraceae bacterium]